MPLPHALRALASRNYRLFFLGQGISLMGNWMTLTASSWLIYELSRDAFLVGFLAFANQVPVLLLAPLGGLLGDRFPRQRLMVWLNTLCALQAVALAVLALTDQITVMRLLALVTVRGFINAAEFPTRQSFIVDLIDRREDLPNAIALNSSLFNVARLLGPALAGFIIALAGPGICYFVDAVSFAAIIASLLAMRVLPVDRATRRGPAWTELRAGFTYARHHPQIRPSLIMVPLIALAGSAASILAPVFARDVFGGTSVTLGNLVSAVGAGALVSAVLLAMRPSPDGLARWVAGGAFAIALGQVIVVFSPTLAPALLGLAFNGFGLVLCMAGNNTLIQSHVTEDKRSRVMGLFAMGQGMFPLGSLIIGGLAAHFGPRAAVAIAAVAVACAGWYFVRASKAFLPGRHQPPRQPAPLPSDSQA